jgi:hypothetical protein
VNIYCNDELYRRYRLDQNEVRNPSDCLAINCKSCAGWWKSVNRTEGRMYEEGFLHRFGISAKIMMHMIRWLLIVPEILGQNARQLDNQGGFYAWLCGEPTVAQVADAFMKLGHTLLLPRDFQTQASWSDWRRAGISRCLFFSVSAKPSSEAH